MKNSVTLGFIGALSGILSFIIANYYQDLEYTAGVVFGLFIGLYFIGFWHHTAHPVKIFLWICTSVVGYYIAVSYVTGLFTKDNQTTFFIAGFLGAGVMLAGFSTFLSRLTWRQYMVLVIFGGVLGLTWFLGDSKPRVFAGSSPFPPALAWLYVCWQTGMAFGIGYCLDINKKSNVA